VSCKHSKPYVLWLFVCLGLFFSIFLLPPAHALPARVTVQLFTYLPRIDKVVISGRCRLVPPSGNAVFGAASPVVFSQDPKNNSRIILGASSRQSNRQNTKGALCRQAFYLDTDNLPVQIKVLGPDGVSKTARYAGSLKIYATAGGIAIQNRLPIKQYLAAVVGSECPPGFSQSSLKAQAVLATNVLHQALKNSSDGCIPDSTQLQSFGGLDHANSRTIAAVDAVFPRMLCDQSTGQPIEVYYSSTCAGGTSDALKIFGSAHNASPISSKRGGVPCTYCQASPFYKPQIYTIDRYALQGKLGYQPMSIEARDERGRPLKIKIQTAPASVHDIKTISGYAFWLDLGKALGWGKIPGNLYDMRTDNANFIFTSRGCGHGVGFCQWGGEGLALKKGFHYQRMLYYYFPRTKIKD
jgi:stage II sporulation protein D